MAKINIKPMSFNRAYRGRVFKSQEYKQYTRDIPFLLPKITVPEGELRLDITFGFSNKASDIDNCIKAFLDLLQDCYGFNDKMVYELNVKKEIVVKGKEYIDFNIEAYVL
jgi:Holliday junction resolvase RusA-like endonuclease